MRLHRAALLLTIFALPSNDGCLAFIPNSLCSSGAAAPSSTTTSLNVLLGAPPEVAEYMKSKLWVFLNPISSTVVEEGQDGVKDPNQPAPSSPSSSSAASNSSSPLPSLPPPLTGAERQRRWQENKQRKEEEASRRARQKAWLAQQKKMQQVNASQGTSTPTSPIALPKSEARMEDPKPPPNQSLVMEVSSPVSSTVRETTAPSQPKLDEERRVAEEEVRLRIQKFEQNKRKAQEAAAKQQQQRATSKATPSNAKAPSKTMAEKTEDTKPTAKRARIVEFSTMHLNSKNLASQSQQHETTPVLFKVDQDITKNRKEDLVIEPDILSMRESESVVDAAAIQKAKREARLVDETAKRLTERDAKAQAEARLKAWQETKQEVDERLRKERAAEEKQRRVEDNHRKEELEARRIAKIDAQRKREETAKFQAEARLKSWEESKRRAEERTKLKIEAGERQRAEEAAITKAEIQARRQAIVLQRQKDEKEARNSAEVRLQRWREAKQTAEKKQKDVIEEKRKAEEHQRVLAHSQVNERRHETAKAEEIALELQRSAETLAKQRQEEEMQGRLSNWQTAKREAKMNKNTAVETNYIPSPLSQRQHLTQPLTSRQRSVRVAPPIKVATKTVIESSVPTMKPKPTPREPAKFQQASYEVPSIHGNAKSEEIEDRSILDKCSDAIRDMGEKAPLINKLSSFFNGKGGRRIPRPFFVDKPDDLYFLEFGEKVQILKNFEKRSAWRPESGIQEWERVKYRAPPGSQQRTRWSGDDQKFSKDAWAELSRYYGTHPSKKRAERKEDFDRQGKPKEKPDNPAPYFAKGQI